MGIWAQVQPKITYANSISMAKQYASSGNADVAFTALSLVLKERGTVLKVDPRLYRPIDAGFGDHGCDRTRRSGKAVR